MPWWLWWRPAWLALVPETCTRIRMENPRSSLCTNPAVGPEVHLCWNRESDSPLIGNFVETAKHALAAQGPDEHGP